MVNLIFKNNTYEQIDHAGNKSSAANNGTQWVGIATDQAGQVDIISEGFVEVCISDTAPHTSLKGAILSREFGESRIKNIDATKNIYIRCQVGFPKETVVVFNQG